MAGIIYELKDVLEQEKECYEGLNTLGTYKETAIINKDIEFLQKIVRSEEEFIGRLNLLMTKREDLMKDISIVTGIGSKQLTVTEIINKIGKETEIGCELTKLREDIKEEIGKIKAQSNTNKRLLEDSIEMVNFSVTALREMRGSSFTGQYTKPGKNDLKGQSSLFDYKQ